MNKEDTRHPPLFCLSVFLRVFRDGLRFSGRRVGDNHFGGWEHVGGERGGGRG